MTQRTGRPPHPDVLTPAEWRVLDEIRAGHPNAEIAVRLGISINTVKYHVSNMLAKLEVTDRHALAAWDGQPRRRFGWLPPLPPIGLSLGTLGRGIAILGGIAAAAAVTAVVLASNGSGAPEARTDVLVRLGTGMRYGALVGIDRLTGAPLAGVDRLDLSDRVGNPLTSDGSLLWYSRGPWYQPLSEEHLVITVVDGAALGLAGSGLPMDTEGVVRRWTLPETDQYTYLSTLSPPPGATDARFYVMRITVDDAPDELWEFDLDSDQPTLLAALPDIADLIRTTDGRLFLLERPEQVPVPEIGETDPDELAAERERYLATARSSIVELSPLDGRELARFEIDGPTSTFRLTPDEQQLYVFTGRDREVTVIDLATMESDPVVFPPGGPWPGVASIGPFASTEWSPDGRRLYLAGAGHSLCDPDQSTAEYCLPAVIGLRVVDLDTNEVIHEDPEVSSLVVSPDGRWLLTSFAAFGPAAVGTDKGIKVIDAATFEVAAHLEPNTRFQSVVVSADGHHAYALSDLGAANDDPNDPCTRSCTAVSVIDLDTLEIIATHTYDEPVAALQAVY